MKPQPPVTRTFIVNSPCSRGSLSLASADRAPFSEKRRSIGRDPDRLAERSAVRISDETQDQPTVRVQILSAVFPSSSFHPMETGRLRHCPLICSLGSVAGRICHRLFHDRRGPRLFDRFLY